MSDSKLTLNTNSIDIDISELTSEVLENYQFIDTRRPDVAAIEPINNIKHKNIPGRELLNNNNFMDPQKGYIFSCYHGNDSRFIAMHFRQQGYPNCFSLRGGYSAIADKQNRGEL